MKRIAIVIAVLILASFVAKAASRKEAKNSKAPTGPFPVLLLSGGRHLDFLRMISSEQDLHENRGFFNRMLDIVAGAPEWRHMMRPYSVATDSHGRLLVTDPGAQAVHIFDFDKNRYTMIEGGKKDSFNSPIGITVDDEDNIYVTDSELGKVFVFDSRGKFRRMIGDIKGEGFYKRPTGIAYDKTNRQLYITDTLRDRVYVTDLNGNVIRYFGVRGTAAGEFNFPTEVVVHGEDVFVVDAMNFRVQMFDLKGAFRAKFGSVGERPGLLFRPKGLSVDRNGNIYLVDAAMETVQVFNRNGDLLYSFGSGGNGVSQFELPSGILVDGKNRIYIADSYNHRVQVFQFVDANQPGGGHN